MTTKKYGSHYHLKGFGKPAYILFTKTDEVHQTYAPGPHTKRKLHREDGPAYFVIQDGVIIEEQWRYNGKLHRLNGPAYKKVGQRGTTTEYYYEGIKYNFDTYQKIVARETIKLL